MRPVKREPAPTVRSLRSRLTTAVDQNDNPTQGEARRVRVNANRPESSRPIQSDAVERRLLRSNYLALKNQINDEREELANLDSDNFERIFNEVENLHQLVQKPREQIADAEALLDIANTLVSSVKTHSSDGVTPSDFVSALLKSFGEPNRGAAAESEQVSIKWKDIGLAVSPMFMKGHGIYTMLGPMDAELKQRKISVQKRRTRPTAETARPDELKGGQADKTDTDKNMAIMFDILRRRKRVTLESLILNRRSFAQTVENLFALSFLVKDGRAEISIDDNRSHFVSPKNAPAANSIASEEVSYSHFIFRFDFKDWKLMMTVVPEGEELMPHREPSDASALSQSRQPPNEPEDDSGPSRTAPAADDSGPSRTASAADDSEEGLATTPIRKLTRNRGLVLHNESVVEDSPEIDNDDVTRANAIRKCRRKLN